MNYCKNIKLGFCEETYRTLEATYQIYTDKIEVKDRHHARAIRRKINHREKVITGDIFYKNLSWYNSQYGIIDADCTGMAIERGGEIIWYSMPGTPGGASERKVLFEKYWENTLKVVMRKIRN